MAATTAKTLTFASMPDPTTTPETPGLKYAFPSGETVIRIAFEAWAIRNGFETERHPSGVYVSGFTVAAWASWNAALRDQREGT